MSLLIVDQRVLSDLAALRALAERQPVDVTGLVDRFKTRAGKAAHMKQMMAQTVDIPGPYPFKVTFSIETGHPGGRARHMSMSIARKERVPNEFALWMIAEALGFVGRLEHCLVYPEDLRGHGKAINVVQLITH